MSTTNLGIIKSEANPLTGTKVQLNTGGWFIAESSAVKKSEIESNKTQTITENGTAEITPSSGKEAMEKVTVTVNVPPEDKKYRCYQTGTQSSGYHDEDNIEDAPFIVFSDTPIDLDNLEVGDEINVAWLDDRSFDLYGLTRADLGIGNRGNMVRSGPFRVSEIDGDVITFYYPGAGTTYEYRTTINKTYKTADLTLAYILTQWNYV
jgi:hypothetical protein